VDSFRHFRVGFSAQQIRLHTVKYSLASTQMEIKGFIDISFSDWDSRVSSVIFLPKCSFRCPFCYNKNLVLESDTMPTIAYDRIKEYLETNKKWIDGVVITGGEPTNHEDLPSLCSDLKRIGFSVKLDTNGTNPAMIRKLTEDNMADYVALDLKAPLTEEEYSKACGVSAAGFLDRIREAIQILLWGNVDYEFRTTVVPTLHQAEDVERICQAVKGCRKYALQNYKSDVETIDPRFQDLKPFSTAEMEAFFQAAKKIVPHTILRG